eukprot:gnl/TRDRNA2_/TRDRNA2_134213_c0_seq1.p1 gnl/TRDRNA2_/TRDRNA2_134213_c0~~gnl/TRDRNA2_/TRDRNA2_134213_c0_seq1.p1  ORF type:complete len:562 (+),score=75.00 gnl/TRDRNA2_/TRDRNA2_134213_c0_seq1:51-1736(+)
MDTHISDRLSHSVAVVSGGRLALSCAANVGRCLVVAPSAKLVRGDAIRDRGLLVGSSCGVSLARACAGGGHHGPSAQDGGTLSELDAKAGLVAEFDLVAAAAEALVFESGNAAQTLDDERKDALHLVSALCRVPKSQGGSATSTVRWVHTRLRSDLQASVPLEQLEDFWRSVPLNWRRSNALPTRGSFMLLQQEAADSAGVSPHDVAAPVLRSDVFVGLFLLTSLAEHSCRPNLGAHWEAGVLHLVALRDIPSGARVATSYLDLQDLALPGPLRRALLEETWGFSCRCDRCLEDLALEGAEAAAPGLRSSSRISGRASGPASGEMHRFTAALIELHELDHRNSTCSVSADSHAMVDVEAKHVALLARCQECLDATLRELSGVPEGYIEQCSLQLLMYRAILFSCREEDVAEIERSCARTLGDHSDWTVTARLLAGGGARALVERAADDSEAAARTAGVCGSAFVAKLSQLRAEALSEDGARRSLQRLLAAGACPTSGFMLLPHGGGYAPRLTRTHSGVVERVDSGTAVRSDQTAPSPPPAPTEKKLSRFKQQMLAQRGALV